MRPSSLQIHGSSIFSKSPQRPEGQLLLIDIISRLKLGTERCVQSKRWSKLPQSLHFQVLVPNSWCLPRRMHASVHTSSSSKRTSRATLELERARPIHNSSVQESWARAVRFCFLLSAPESCRSSARRLRGLSFQFCTVTTSDPASLPSVRTSDIASEDTSFGRCQQKLLRTRGSELQRSRDCTGSPCCSR